MAEPSNARVQYFNVQCPAGHRVRGERTIGYQALRCPGCGEGIFVLPLSPLPEPVAPPRATPSRPIAPVAPVVEDGPVQLVDVPASTEFSPDPNSGVIDADVDWEDSEAEASGSNKAESAAAAGQAGSKPTDRPGPTRPRSRSAVAGPVDPSAKPPGTASTRPSVKTELRGPKRSRRRPLLIFLAVSILALGTLGLRLWRSRRQELPGIYDQGRSEGIAALDAGRFDKAYQLLSAAKGAVDSLGGGLEGAEEVRQAANEAAVFVDLLPEPLEEILNEAGPMEPQNWENRFKAFYAGRSVVIDTRIEAVPSSDGSSGYEVDYLILPPGEATRFRENGALEPQWMAKLDLSDIELFQLSRPRVGDHVVFGAKLASFTFDSKSGMWIVRFRPRSGVFITHAKALESLGWPTDSIAAETPTEAE